MVLARGRVGSYGGLRGGVGLYGSVLDSSVLRYMSLTPVYELEDLRWDMGEVLGGVGYEGAGVEVLEEVEMLDMISGGKKVQVRVGRRFLV